MIYVKIPKCPKKADFGISDVQVQNAKDINEKVKNKERTYDKKNNKIAYALSYIIICVIAGCIIGGSDSDISELGLVIVSCIIGLLSFVILPIGGFISDFLQGIGKELEPNRIPMNDDEYSRSHAYIQAKKQV